MYPLSCAYNLNSAMLYEKECLIVCDFVIFYIIIA